MKFQLKLLQDGHYLNDQSNSITIYWNHMLLTLQCCGVYNQYDTISSTYGSKFCCENAHESIIDIRNTSSTNALNYGGCGGYKRVTCSESILFETRMYIGWFLTLLLLQICLEINQALEETLQNDIIRYQYSHASAHYDTYSLYWNTLFIKCLKTKYILTLQAQCCGVGTTNVWSMNGSYWFARNRDSSYQQIPVQCCKSQTVVYPYASKTDTDCTNFMGCDAAIQNQLEKYSIPFMVFTSIIIVAEFVGTNPTIEISCATTSKSDRKHSIENVRYTGQTSNTEKESSVNKIERLNMANISSEENVSHSKAFQPSSSLDNETDANQDDMREQDQKIHEDTNETKNVSSGYEKNDHEGNKMTSLEEDMNVLSEEQISEKNENTEI
ncbi:unnamed protein product [Mytilus coruscus]|uniref:Uncharacterized protein n=1 Tax=Mytilus coruscus TaxID=42192 RepID=A0A6J8BDJ0_MYTCO|nr:unnamed protein product [Mytilus coruscus]